MMAMNFTETDYYQQSFTKISLDGNEVKNKNFEESVFEDCHFLNCSFEKSRFLNCQFRGCVISAVGLLNCRFIQPIFRKCKVLGIDWTKTKLFREPEFYDCQIDFSNFRMLKIPGVKIINCEAREVEFIETDFSGGVFTGTDFERSRFFKTNLSGADFRGAKNYSIDITNNMIKKARFSYPEVISLLDGLEITIE
jgi:fluoroquinolone resistance protein